MKPRFWAILLLLATIPFGIGGAAEIGALAPLTVKAKLAELGKRLFFDKRLSGDAALSCASCHIPEKGFADGMPLSDAYPGTKGFRNTPTLINTAYKAVWFHDGRIGTNLNDATRDQITETLWMNMDMRIMQERLKQDPIYVRMFADAGLGEPSNGGVRKAIPEYLKTLTSQNAAFDSGTMSEAQKRGEALFRGKGGCVRCHDGPLFTDGKAHNLGVPENPTVFREPLRHVAFIAFANFMGIQNYMNLRRDPGAAVRSNVAADMGKFVTPTLRETHHTSPYMHNGVLKTLWDVVDFYDQGGGRDPNKDPLLKRIGLTFAERGDLVAFLHALGGDPLTSGQHVWKPKIDLKYKPIPNWWTVRN